MSIPTQRTFTDLIDDLNASADRIAAEKASKPAEAEFIWTAFTGERLSDDLMTPTDAAEYAVDMFEDQGKLITVKGGAVGVEDRNGDITWYHPSTPNFPPLMWLRDGDQSDYPLGSAPDVWFTVDQAEARIKDGGADRIERPSDREIVAYHGGYVTRWIGVPFLAENVTCDEAQQFADRSTRTLTEAQHEAVSAWVMAKADRTGGHLLAKVEDALMVALMDGVK